MTDDTKSPTIPAIPEAVVELLPCPLCATPLQEAADPRLAGMLEHPAKLSCPISATCFLDTPELRTAWNRRLPLVPATSVVEPSEATERTLDERMKKGASDFAAILNVDQGYIEGVKAAAKKVAKRRDGYVEEHGSYDPDTGATEFPGTGEEYVGELDEIEEEILTLLSAPVAKNG